MQTFGKYQVLEQVGEGGFGRVYRGFDPVLKREVAIKTCHLHGPDLRERFGREAEIAASLRHPGIVTVFDFGEEAGVPYLVQEFLTGEDLEHLLERGEPGRLEHRVWILRQAGEALQYAHARGVVHRDVKPANIRVEADGSVRLMDFGIAKLVQTDRQLTQMGFSLGTVGYLSPEQLLGREIDHRADVFSFGVLSYEVLTGTKPFGGDSVTAVLYAIANAEPEPLEGRVPGVSRRLSAVVERCLRKDPGERFQHMGLVVEELDAVMAELRTGSAGVQAGAGPVVPASPGAGAGSAPSPRGNDPAGGPLPEAGRAPAAAPPRRSGRRAAVALGLAAATVAVFGILNLATFSRGAEGEGAPLAAAGSAGGIGTASDPVDPEAAPPGPGSPGSEEAPLPDAGAGEPGPASAAPGEPPSASPASGSAGTVPADAPGTSATPTGPTPAPPAQRSVESAAPATAPAPTLDASRLVLVAGGADGGWDRAEAALVAGWLREGVGVPDPASLGGRGTDAAGGDPAAVRALALERGAATVVVATLRTGAAPSVNGFFTGSAELVLRRYDGSSGELLGIETVQVGSGGVPGKLGPTPEAALGDAAAEAGERGAALVARRLRDR